MQIARLDELLDKRRRAAKMYDQALDEIEEIQLPPMTQRDQASWFVYVIRLRDRFTRTDRDALIAALRDSGIGCSNYFVPIHTQPYIMEMLGVSEGDYPVTEHVADRTIALPFFANLRQDQVDCVKQALCDALLHRVAV